MKTINGQVIIVVDNVKYVVAEVKDGVVTPLPLEEVQRRALEEPLPLAQGRPRVVERPSRDGLLTTFYVFAGVFIMAVLVMIFIVLAKRTLGFTS